MLSEMVESRFPVGAYAPAEARRSLAPLAGSIPRERHEDLTLVVSELVANSVRHGGMEPDDEPIILRVTPEKGRLRAEVVDHGFGFEAPERPIPRPDAASRWGFYLVDALTDDWGVKRDDRTTVWFEMSWDKGDLGAH
jgi:anti-sigma regulatory factor (Ser/Thr protein kinase)